jgi:hypothetical protein
MRSARTDTNNTQYQYTEYEMIKKIKPTTVIIAMLVSLPIVTYAKPHMCPFNDKFTLNAPAQVKIINAIPQGNVYYTQKSDTNFVLSCADSSGLSGTLIIKIGYDNDNHCSLSIKDGPYEMNPSVESFYCSNGIKKLAYIGMDHQRGSYDYTLKFQG